MNDQDFYDSMKVALETPRRDRDLLLLGYEWAFYDLRLNSTEHWWKGEVVTLLRALTVDGRFDEVET
jgi:hypothetical protein